MEISTILTIIGGFISILLIANGFFLKGIFTGQNAMQVEIARLLEKVENFSGRISELEHKFRKLEIDQIKCRGECESTNTAMRH